MQFTATPEAYDRYMGRYSRPLARELIAFAQVEPSARALDVGCGPGSLTEALAELLGAGRVSAADPAEQFAAACARRVPGADVRVAAAERLPWDDDAFDATLSQLALNFFADPDAGIRELRRVTRTGGIVAACTWDYANGMEMLRRFWQAAVALDPEAPVQSEAMRMRSEPELREAWEDAGLRDVTTGELAVETRYADFDDLWEPFLGGVGPGGAYVARLDDERRAELREEFRRRVGEQEGPFALPARACAVRGVVP
jgi:ubiquinone/menaquinone biosynthesis C-methylase UbiE